MGRHLFRFGPASFVLSIGLGGAACIAPLSHHPSGRSVGTGNTVVAASLSAIQDSDESYVAMPEIRWLHGVGKNLDFGIETVIPVNAGLVVRYSLINPESDGLALAVHGRMGISPWSPASGYYAAAGSTLSFREARWEPFLVTRFNLSRVDISSSTDNRFLFPDSSDEFDEEYMSHSAGLAWWTGEHKHLFASLTFIHGIEGEFDEIEDSFLLTIGFSAGTTGFFRVP